MRIVLKQNIADPDIGKVIPGNSYKVVDMSEVDYLVADDNGKTIKVCNLSVESVSGPAGIYKGTVTFKHKASISPLRPPVPYKIDRLILSGDDDKISFVFRHGGINTVDYIVTVFVPKGTGWFTRHSAHDSRKLGGPLFGKIAGFVCEKEAGTLTAKGNWTEEGIDWGMCLKATLIEQIE